MQVPVEPQCRVRFADRGSFSRELDERADAYFAKAAEGRRDIPRMYLKSLIIMTWFVGSWVLLVFFAKNAWQGTLCAMSLGLSIAGVGMSVQHDGNHSAFSKHLWINRVFGSTLDVMGVCSFMWRVKHNIGHHTFTNVQTIDYDLDFGVLARLSKEQRHRSWHRGQHLYLWFFYGFLLPKWVFHDDWVILKSRYIGVHKLPPPSRADLFNFAFWKIFFVAWSLVIPAFFHPIWQVLVFHLVAAFTLGSTLGTIFQLAHCTGEAEFPPPAPLGERMSDDWAAHQLATTVDFGPTNPLLTWFAGGLNFQVEHHLFPKVCHLHYPALARIVAEVAERHGLKHRSEATFSSALASHFMHLRAMSRRPTPAPEQATSPVTLPVTLADPASAVIALTE